MYQKIVSTDENDQGLSPVIGVVLMVALVVALVALVSITVFNVTDENNSDDSVAGSSIDFTATTDGVKVTVVRQGDADEFIVKVDGEEVGDRLQESGDSTTIQAEGVYSVVGDFGDSQEVIVSKEVTGTINGLFTVFQDQEDGTVEAQLVERYENEDEYTIVTDSSDDDDGSTTSFSMEEDDGRLLSYGGEERLLQDLPETVPDSAASVINVTAAPEERPAPVEVGEKAKLHKTLGSWCAGDDILLVGEDGETVLDGDEFEFDNNCGSVQTVTQYNGAEITGVKIINTWGQSIDYSMYTFNGQVEPPQIGVASDGSESMNIEVYEQGNSIDTDNPIENAKVTVGNKRGPTNASGGIEFTEIPTGNNYFITVNADGFDGTQTTFQIEDDGSFTFDEFTAGSGSDSSPSTVEDGGEYVVDGNTIKIALEEFNPSVKVIEQTTVDPGGSTTIDFSSNGIDSSTSNNVGITAGTTSSATSSGDTSYSGGSVSSGGSFSYSSTTTKSTQTVTTSEETVVEGQEYVPEPPNDDMEVTESETADLPDRDLSAGEIGQSEIPLGEQIQIEASARTYTETEVEDKLLVYQAPVKDDGSSGELEPILNRSITLPPGTGTEPGNTVTETIDLKLTDNTDDDSLSPSEAGIWNPDNEYAIYVALNSTGDPQEAGTIDVFEDSLSDAEIDLSSSNVTAIDADTGNKKDPSSAYVGDDISVSVDNVVTNITPSNYNGGPTVDLYRNGELVKRVSDYDGGEITYSETTDEAEYIDFHVGIKQATTTSLLDTAVVNDFSVDGSNEINTFDADVQIADKTNCVDKSDSNYDCELEAGTSSLTFDMSASDFGGLAAPGDLDTSQLTIGSQRTYNDVDPTSTYDSDQFNDDTTHLVEYKAVYTDSDGNTITAVDTLTVNVFTNTDEVTSQVTGVTTPGDDEFTVQMESDRSSLDEKVNVVIESNTGDGDAQGTYIINDKKIRPGVTEEVTVNVPEIAYGDSGGTGDIYTGSTGEDDAIASLTESDGSVPFSVKLQDASDNTNVTGTEETFTINPDGEIEADITADVRVNECPDGSSPVTVSGASSGTCDVTVLSTDDGTDDLTFRFGQFGYNNPDRFEVINPSGNIVNSGSGTFTTGNSQGDDIQVSPVESGVYEVVFYDSSGNSRVVESIDTTEVSP